MPLRTGRPALVALLLSGAALALTLAACGGGGAATAASSSADQQDTARLQLAKCLRDHGVNIPDQPPAGGGTTGGGRGGGFRQAFTQAGRAKLQAAFKACAKYRTAAFGNITPQQRQAFQDAFVKFSACMRQHGVDVPTPNFNGGGPGTGGGPGAGGGFRRLDRSDPKVAQALKACQSSLPNGGRGGFFRGGGPPPPQ